MKITLKDPELPTKIRIGTKRHRVKKFLWFPKILKMSQTNPKLQFRIFWFYSWEEEMQEWLEDDRCHLDHGYTPRDTTPNTYGWRATHWVD
jgi:hypothetical protein